VVYVVRAVYKFDFRLLINKHLANGDQWGEKKKSCSDTETCFFLNSICIFDRDLRHHCLKTLPTCAGQMHSLEQGAMIILSTYTSTCSTHDQCKIHY